MQGMSEEFYEQQKEHVQRPCGARDQGSWCKKRLAGSRDLNRKGLQTVIKGFKEGQRAGCGQTCLLKRHYSQILFPFIKHTFLNTAREEDWLDQLL